MEILSDLLLFTGKLSVLILALSAIALGLLWLIQRTQQMKESIEVTSLSDRFHLNASLLRMASASKKERKSLRKEIENFEAKNQKKPVAYVIDFKGDIKASEAENLGEEVNAILAATSEPTEIVLRLESTGGVVHGYGLAAAQILRLRNAGHKVTICVDKVAASGGYMMACVGHQILASPFAILGSVGVIAQIPNFYRLLQKWDVDYREYTAGEFKRTVSLFGQITEKGEEKFKQQIEETHQLFKEFVHRFRPQLDLPRVSTGEYWFGEQALRLGLIDAIKTSNEYLMELAKSHRILSVRYSRKLPWSEKFSGYFSQALHRALRSLLQELEDRRIV